MKSKAIFRLFLLAASAMLLAVVWAGRIVIELLALFADTEPRVPRDARERRYSHDHDGYSWESRPDEMK